MHDVSHIIQGAMGATMRHLVLAVVWFVIASGGKTLWKIVRGADT
jgi:hypothetical protein